MNVTKLEPYQERVLEEKQELDKKIVKLRRYLREHDDPLLMRQWEVMEQYSRILTERMGKW